LKTNLVGGAKGVRRRRGNFPKPNGPNHGEATAACASEIGGGRHGHMKREILGWNEAKEESPGGEQVDVKRNSNS